MTLLNNSDILVKVFPENKIAADISKFPSPVLRTEGWDFQVVSWLLLHQSDTNNCESRVTTLVILSNKTSKAV